MALFGKKKKDAGAENPVAGESEGVNLSKAKPAKEKPAKKEKKSGEPKGAEQKNSEPKVQKPKARPDIYTLLLGLSVAALVLAVVLLFLNINAYGLNPLSGVPR
jgi:hypothetical protein